MKKGLEELFNLKEPLNVMLPIGNIYRNFRIG